MAEANEKFYFNKADGFIGIGLKRDDNTEMLFNCSALDDVIVFYNDGRYKVVRVPEKLFIGKNVRHIGIYNRRDERMIYNVIYQDGRGGAFYKKRPPPLHSKINPRAPCGLPPSAAAAQAESHKGCYTRRGLPDRPPNCRRPRAPA